MEKAGARHDLSFSLPPGTNVLCSQPQGHEEQHRRVSRKKPRKGGMGYLYFCAPRAPSARPATVLCSSVNDKALCSRQTDCHHGISDDPGSPFGLCAGSCRCKSFCREPHLVAFEGSGRLLLERRCDLRACNRANSAEVINGEKRVGLVVLSSWSLAADRQVLWRVCLGWFPVELLFMIHDPPWRYRMSCRRTRSATHRIANLAHRSVAPCAASLVALYAGT